MRIKQEEPLPIKDGVMEMLSFLKENGWRMAVASSTYHDQVKKNLERNGLAGFFSEVIGGDEVEKAKPEPDIFLAAERTPSYLSSVFGGNTSKERDGRFSFKISDIFAIIFSNFNH